MKKTVTVLILSLFALLSFLCFGCNTPVPGISVYKPEKCYNGYTLF